MAAPPDIAYNKGMPRQQIQETLTSLHQQLQGTSHLDDDARAQLREVLRDIERVLDAGEATDSIGDRVKQVVAGFEVSHPTVAAGLHEIVESLRKL